MSDENPGASATALPPSPAPPAGDVPATHAKDATDIDLPKEEVAPAKASGLAEPGVSTGEQEVSDKLDDRGAAADATVGPAGSADDDKMMDASDPGPALAAGSAKESPVADKVATPSSKAKGRRKSAGGAESKGKKLNKKASKAKFTHLDAKPGDHFFVKLKGFPQWPAIICDENMLPQALIKSRPVTAAREDGTYREDYADGGKRVADRTYPVMYLHTNEFGWIPNTDLHDLDPKTVMDVKMDKMRKDLQEAHKLAAEANSLLHYKEVLQHYQDDLLEKQKAKEAKAQSTPAKKSKKAKAEEEDEDVDMAEAEDGVKEKKNKKRKADESAETPQRSDSVKKPRIKLTVNSTPKASNGTTPKSKGQTTTTKPVKIKTKKADSEPKDNMSDTVESKAEANSPPVPPEVQLARKEKEVLFIRHKLQKGLLSREVKPKASEMQLMADFITKLEKLENLEVDIIRATKINKVLKAILKLKEIPREDDFHFKPRSQALLDIWNKVLEAPPAEASGNELTQAMDGIAIEGSDSKKELKSSGDDQTHDESKTNGTQEKNAAEKKSVAEDKGVSEEKDTAAREAPVAAAREAPVAAADEAKDKEAAAVEASG